MPKETLTLSHKETERLRVLERVEACALTLKEAAELMGVSYRQAKRLIKQLRAKGARGLSHGLRGRPSNRRTPKEFRQKVVERYSECYQGFGPTLAAEKLAQDGLAISHDALGRLLKAKHLWLGRQVERLHRRRRARREHLGELVQMDGSDHPWFEGRAGRCCLMVMVDDATGRLWARFGPSENLRLAMETLAGWIGHFGGMPQALYADRLSLYHAQREPTEDERAQGSGALSQFGEVCWRLGARIIAASSPQAKGRVERMNRTLQDRLVKELRLAAISSIEAANGFLEGGYLDDLSERFAHEPASTVDFHRRLPEEADLLDTVCLEASRQVQNDWTLTYEARQFQILAQEGCPQRKSRVTVRERLDGKIMILKDGRSLAFREIAKVVSSKPNRSPTPAGVGEAGLAPQVPPQPVTLGDVRTRQLPAA